MDSTRPDDDVIATLYPRASRRWFGIAVLGCLGALLMSLALGSDIGGGWRATFGLFALVAGLEARRLYRATVVFLELTQSELRDSTGEVLCRIDDVVKVERGAFAFKPSNGFLLRTRAPLGRAWKAGLWWRVGRMVGVGGVTGAGEGKLIAEIIAMRVAERGSQG